MASDGIGPKGPGPNTGLGPEAIHEIADETAASVIELSGVIKWFDVAKGYGFIVPDNGLPDVLLHVTCLRRDGFQTAYEGARVVCEVLQRPKGLQAFRILSMDETTAVHPAQLPPARTHVSVTPTSGLEVAIGHAPHAIGMSFGGGPDSAALDAAIQAAYDRGIVLVAAAAVCLARVPSTKGTLGGSTS
jgi:cold shock CspA family protein